MRETDLEGLCSHTSGQFIRTNPRHSQKAPLFVEHTAQQEATARLFTAENLSLQQVSERQGGVRCFGVMCDGRFFLPCHAMRRDEEDNDADDDNDSDENNKGREGGRPIYV